MISIGLDLSMNSTGVCVYFQSTNQSIYYIIGNKFTKKSIHFIEQGTCRFLNTIQLTKHQVDKDAEYHEKENAKTLNIRDISKAIKKILERWHPDVVTIEGVSYGSAGAVADLTGLNYVVRMCVHDLHINKLYVVTPTQNKKFATGNGSAEKDQMISAWKKMDPNVKNIPQYIKVDDIADAYCLARYGEHLYNQDINYTEN